MRDLYSRLGIDRDASVAGIEAAVSKCQDRELAESAKMILLGSASTRRDYDSCHRTLNSLSVVRNTLRIRVGSSWGQELNDFQMRGQIESANIESEMRRLLTHEPKSGAARLRPFHYFLIASGLLIAFLAYSDNQQLSGSARSSATENSRPKASDRWRELANQSSGSNRVPQLIPAFAEPEQPLPANGSVLKSAQNAVAPLEIKTSASGGHTFVKLIRVGGKSSELEFFVRRGQTVEVEVPLNEYEIRYAVGSTWYGRKHLFGPNTGYFRADDTFRFYRDSTGFIGYTVELISQLGGNLETERIDEADF